MRAAGQNVGQTFIKEGKIALRNHWLLLMYLVLLMAGFNFMSHGSQDLYPTMLSNQYRFSPDAVTVTQVSTSSVTTTSTLFTLLIFGSRWLLILAR